MTSDPTSLMIFSLVVLAVNIAILILMKHMGRPIVLMTSAATFIFCMQLAFYAYQLQHIDVLIQALGSGAFFGLFQYSIVHQILMGCNRPAEPKS
jgi:hypothetical protein